MQTTIVIRLEGDVSDCGGIGSDITDSDTLPAGISSTPVLNSSTY